jgi:hypothetical protein
MAKLAEMKGHGRMLASQLAEANVEAESAASDAAFARIEFEDARARHAVLSRERDAAQVRHDAAQQELKELQDKERMELGTLSAIVGVRVASAQARTRALESEAVDLSRHLSALRDEALPELEGDAKKAAVLKEDVAALKLTLSLSAKGQLASAPRNIAVNARKAALRDAEVLRDLEIEVATTASQVEALRDVVREAREVRDGVAPIAEAAVARVRAAAAELSRLRRDRAILAAAGYGYVQEPEPLPQQQQQQQQQQQSGPSLAAGRWGSSVPKDGASGHGAAARGFSGDADPLALLRSVAPAPADGEGTGGGAGGSTATTQLTGAALVRSVLGGAAGALMKKTAAGAGGAGVVDPARVFAFPRPGDAAEAGRVLRSALAAADAALAVADLAPA